MGFGATAETAIGGGVTAGVLAQPIKPVVKMEKTTIPQPLRKPMGYTPIRLSLARRLL
jgi:hypothetical protein